MGDKYEGVSCDSYTYRGRIGSMRRVITAAGLASGPVERPHDNVDRTRLIVNGSRPFVPGCEVFSRNRNERSGFSSVLGNRPRTVCDRVTNLSCGHGLSAHMYVTHTHDACNPGSHCICSFLSTEIICGLYLLDRLPVLHSSRYTPRLIGYPEIKSYAFSNGKALPNYRPLPCRPQPCC